MDKMIRARLWQDGDIESPREWSSNLGEFAHWHRRYDLGDRKATDTELEALRRGGWDLLFRYLRLTRGATQLIPIGMYDHSGVTIWAAERGDLRTGGRSRWDSAGWDSGYVGFIFDTTETRAECGTALEHIAEGLRNEIKDYDDYMQGNAYGYTVETRTLCVLCAKAAERVADDQILGDEVPDDCPHCTIEVDSCGGFLGDPKESGIFAEAGEHGDLLREEYDHSRIEVYGYGRPRIEAEWRAA